jgi:hypothetical protein
MRVSTICARIATELRSASFVTAGLKQSYYPAPGSLAETPAAVVFAGLGLDTPMMGEQVWEHEIRVQVMVKPGTSYAGSINAIEPLIEEIWDHFYAGGNAYHLRQTGSGQMVHRCQPTRYESSQLIEYAGVTYVALTIYFNVKTHRHPGDD